MAFLLSLIRLSCLVLQTTALPATPPSNTTISTNSSVSALQLEDGSTLDLSKLEVGKSKATIAPVFVVDVAIFDSDAELNTAIHEPSAPWTSSDGIAPFWSMNGTHDAGHAWHILYAYQVRNGGKPPALIGIVTARTDFGRITVGGIPIFIGPAAEGHINVVHLASTRNRTYIPPEVFVGIVPVFLAANGQKLVPNRVEKVHTVKDAPANLGPPPLDDTRPAESPPPNAPRPPSEPPLKHPPNPLPITPPETAPNQLEGPPPLDHPEPSPGSPKPEPPSTPPDTPPKPVEPPPGSPKPNPAPHQPYTPFDEVKNPLDHVQGEHLPPGMVEEWHQPIKEIIDMDNHARTLAFDQMNNLERIRQNKEDLIKAEDAKKEAKTKQAELEKARAEQHALDQQKAQELKQQHKLEELEQHKTEQAANQAKADQALEEADLAQKEIKGNLKKLRYEQTEHITNQAKVESQIRKLPKEFPAKKWAPVNTGNHLMRPIPIEKIMDPLGRQPGFNTARPFNPHDPTDMLGREEWSGHMDTLDGAADVREATGIRALAEGGYEVSGIKASAEAMRVMSLKAMQRLEAETAAQMAVRVGALIGEAGVELVTGPIGWAVMGGQLVADVIEKLVHMFKDIKKRKACLADPSKKESECPLSPLQKFRAYFKSLVEMVKDKFKDCIKDLRTPGWRQIVFPFLILLGSWIPMLLMC